MHKCGGVQEEDYKFNSIVFLDSGKLGWFFYPDFPDLFDAPLQMKG